MKRTLYAELLKWKDIPNRKPLILQGVRQVGKTYLVSEFAENEYRDFIIENEGKVYPLEVKSGTNLNLKSLKSYSDKFKPELKFRASPRNFIRSGDFINVPLYAVSLIKGLI